jgi:hypothetical protein
MGTQLTSKVMSTLGSISMQYQVNTSSSMQSWQGSEHIRGSQSVWSWLGTCSNREQRASKREEKVEGGCLHSSEASVTMQLQVTRLDPILPLLLRRWWRA